MVKLKYSSYDTMPIRVFYKLKEVLDDKEMDPMDKEFNVMAILMDISYDDILEYPISEVQELYCQLDFISEFNNKPKDKKFKYIVINDKKYNIIQDVKSFNVAQYIDFQTYIKNSDKYLGEMLSVFIIPKGKKYNEDYNIVEVINDIYDYMPITTANSLMFFFIKRLAHSINRTLTYWELAMMMMMPKKKKEIAKKVEKLKEIHGYLLSILSQK